MRTPQREELPAERRTNHTNALVAWWLFYLLLSLAVKSQDSSCWSEELTS
uniref:Uncharacterized protein n=1 Tax=Nelumbo nucifera TaxID=4432 RepID=A0A822Y7Z8_NELNU|nr:TPA_asm: hypothetical protein HUJ06_028613 [Nelumbo nucifera]